MRHATNQENRFMFIVGVILIGSLLFPVYTNSNEEGKELEWSRLLLSKGREFFNKGNYSAAVDMLKDFVEKSKSQKKQLKNEYAQAYYILARIYFDAEEIKNMEENLKNLFQTDLDYQIPGSEDAAFKKKAEFIRLEIEKTRKITANFSIGDIDGPVQVVFFELNPKNMKKFPDPKKIMLELPGPGTYCFYFFKDNRYIQFDGKVSENLEEKTIDFKKAREIPVLKPGKEKIAARVQEAKTVFRFIEKEALVPAHNQERFKADVDIKSDQKVRLELVLEMEPFHQDKVEIILEKPLKIDIKPGEHCQIGNGKIVLKLSPAELPKKRSGEWRLRIINKYPAEVISLKKAELSVYPIKNAAPEQTEREE